MKNHIYKIIFTIVWIIFAIWFNSPVDNGRQIGDMWIDGGDLLVKTSEPTFNIGFFALFMIPVAVVWIWSFFKNESDGKPVKRKSRRSFGFFFTFNF